MNPSPPKRVILLANGSLPDPDYARSLLRAEDLVIAANGGSRLAWELRITPDLVIGDRDSLSSHIRTWLERSYVPSLSYSVDKDATDLELALRHVISLGTRSVFLLGLAGGRVDHMLANFSLLTLAAAAKVQVEAVIGREHLYLVYPDVDLELSGKRGQTVSVLPWGGDALGVEMRGFKWDLADEDLPFGPARGISNIMRKSKAYVRVQAGILLVSHHRG